MFEYASGCWHVRLEAWPDVRAWTRSPGETQWRHHSPFLNLNEVLDEHGSLGATTAATAAVAAGRGRDELTVRIPRVSGHPFHANPATDSTGIRPPIPRVSGHPPAG